MAKESKPLAPVAIYCRISSDRDGEGLGVERQENDCKSLCERLGWDVGAVFIENDISASTKSRKPRPLYAEMLTRARAGEFGAIVAYSNSRLTRRFREFIDLIELAEQRSVRIVTVVSGEDNLATADGRQYARIKASIDTGEAERIAERVRRAKEGAAQDGRYRGGRRPYGYRKDGKTIIESEAEVLRWTTAAVLEGRSLTAVAAELNQRGVKTSTGNTWTYQLLKEVLNRPRNAALIGRGRYAELEIVGPAQWDAIIDPDTWRALHSLLTDPSRRTQKGTERRWLGAGLYRCGRCGAPMRTATYGEKFHYKCSESAHLTVLAVKTDEYVRQVVVDLIRDPRVVTALTPTDDGAATAADRERRAVLAARLGKFERDYAEENITAAQLKKATARVTAELQDVDARLAVGMQRSASSPILNAVDPGSAFLSAPIDVQRQVLAACLTVEVLPRPKDERGKAWTSDRLRLSSPEGLRLATAV